MRAYPLPLPTLLREPWLEKKRLAVDVHNVPWRAVRLAVFPRDNSCFDIHRMDLHRMPPPPPKKIDHIRRRLLER